LLSIFWDSHNPTVAKGQKHDWGSQYRSILLYTTPEQREAIVASKAQLEAGRYRNRGPIATQIAPATEFWRAEEYHQQYYEKHNYYSCRIS
jgi:peptide-methionine (S)-S-oxide reductase